MPRTLAAASRLLASSAAIALMASAFSTTAATPPIPPACQTEACAFLDKSLTPDARAKDLVARMTLEEKAWQMGNAAPALPRLGLPAYDWWNEVLHGLARAGHATVYPQAIGMAATWDKGLMLDIGQAIATEGRANYNAELARRGGTARYFGVNYWSPNINIFRDPRWGRGQETYGEDPYLAGHLAIPFIKGIQGEDSNYFKGIATPKHFVVHSGPEPLRHGFNVDVSKFDLEDTYTPAFRSAIVDGQAYSMMCAYNAIDGFPACASPLMENLVRKDWGFKGFIVSDCDSVDDMVTGHKSHKDHAAASAVAIRAGTDLDCGDSYRALPGAVRAGLISEAEIDKSLIRLMDARIRMGLIDGGKYDDIPLTAINTPEHRALALRAAEEAIVLLNNSKGLLPLKGSEKIAVIGPNAQHLQSLEGNYTGAAVDPSYPLNGLTSVYGDRVTYAPGSALMENMPIEIPSIYLKPAAGSRDHGLKGEYFDNPTFSVAPKMTRTDEVINFDFYHTGPTRGFEPLNFSVRWTGVLTPPAAGTYRIGFRMSTPRAGQAQPNVKVWLDGKQIVQGDMIGKTAEVTFTDTKPHEIRVDYVRANEDRLVALDWIAPPQVLIDDAVKAAQASDVVVAFAGLSPDLEGEEMKVDYPGFDGGDRLTLALPEAQRNLLEAVKATGKPLVVVYLTGGAVSDPWVEQNADALVQAWYPGQAGGQAIARTLTGAANPAGRLPYTIYRDVTDLPAFGEYNMANRTYRYFKGDVLHPFGKGLSYTTFAYNAPALSAISIKAGQPVTVTTTVRNSGVHDGDEVVQLYVSKPVVRGAPNAKHALAGFERIHLKAGESRQVTMTLDARTLSAVDGNGVRKVRPGTYTVHVGGGQPGHATTVKATLKVSGTAAVPK
jgi:beta-glucosidase